MLPQIKTLSQARTHFLKCEARLGASQDRHRHWKSQLTADMLVVAQNESRASYAVFKGFQK